MSAMTCADAVEQLGLLAADACDPPTRELLEGHLHKCPTCAAKFTESQRLQLLLDLHWSEQGLKRLQQRIDQQARPSRRVFAPIIRRSLAVAAMLLITVSLVWWLPNRIGNQQASEPEFALLVLSRKPVVAPGPEKLPAKLQSKNAEAVAVIPLVARGGKDFRDELAKAKRDGKLPPPPAVSLDIALVNTGKQSVEVRLGAAAPMLELELPGDGVVRIAAPDAAEPEFLRPRSLQLAPGKQHVMHIDRLIAGSRGKLEYIYVTEPGEYTLTARVRLNVAGKVVIVTGTPVRIKVGN